MINLLRYFATKTHRRRCCVILFFDNIDRLPDIVQNRLLFDIISFSEKCGAKALICIRLTGFSWIDAGEAFDLNPFPNIGHRPRWLMRERIDHFLNNQEEYSTITNAIPSHHLSAFIARARVVRDYLKLDKPIISKAIDALSGNSIRRGMKIIPNVFLNSRITWSAVDPNVADLARTLFLPPWTSQESTFNHNYVSNLFLSPVDNKFSMMLARIIQILNHHERTAGVYTKLQYLYYKLHQFGYDTSILHHAINILGSQRKKLLYIDGTNEYGDEDAIVNSPRDIVYLTSTGKQYAKKLIYLTPYIQECFWSIDWSTDELPTRFNYRNPIERFRVLRKCLRLVQEVDKKEVNTFITNSTSGRYNFSHLTSSKMVASASESAYWVLTNITDAAKYEELLDWQSLINISIGMDEEFLGKTSPELRKQYNMYLSMLKAANYYHK